MYNIKSVKFILKVTKVSEVVTENVALNPYMKLLKRNAFIKLLEWPGASLPEPCIRNKNWLTYAFLRALAQDQHAPTAVMLA
jgi:hypothetical protein